MTKPKHMNKWSVTSLYTIATQGNFQANMKIGQHLSLKPQKCPGAVLYYFHALQIILKKLKYPSSKSSNKLPRIPQKYKKKNLLKLPSEHFLIDPQLEYISLENEYMDHNKKVSTIPQHLYKVLDLLKKSKSFASFEKERTTVDHLSDMEFLGQHEYFTELGQAFLYGRAGIAKNHKKALFFFRLATQYGDQEGFEEMCKYFLVLQDYDKAFYCFKNLRASSQVSSSFEVELIKYLKRGYVKKKEFMKLFFFARTGAMNDKNMATFYYIYFSIKMKGKWLGDLTPPNLKFLESCVKDGDPACAYLQGDFTHFCVIFCTHLFFIYIGPSICNKTFFASSYTLLPKCQQCST